MKLLKRVYYFGAIFFISCNGVKAQAKTDDLLISIFKDFKNSALDTIIYHPLQYRCQVIYTQINREKSNNPLFSNYYFNYDPLLYFNPASTVKLPLAALSLEKLHTLPTKGINKFTTIVFDSSLRGQKPLNRDTTAISSLPSIAHFIKRAFLISENDPYNRMYQFVGQADINRSLHRKGYTGIRITRQFSGFDAEQNRHTNPVRFINKNGNTIYSQPALYNVDSFNFSRIIKLGNGYFDKNDNLVKGPFDFTQHNNIPLGDLQEILQAILFPSSVKEQQRFKLTNSDYRFLYQYLSQYSSETNDPKYDTAKFYDSYVKFFFRNETHKIPSQIRIFNKVGWSYGFMTDVAYVIDTKNKIEFMLAATIYVNSDGIINDGKYDYNSLGYPFFYALGQAIYNYELKRPRKYKPDLAKFIIKYEGRRPDDHRPSLKDVDN
jgi:hypothetical protein